MFSPRKLFSTFCLGWKWTSLESPIGPSPIGASKIVGYLVLQKITNWSWRALHTELITRSSKSNMFILTLSIFLSASYQFENYSNDKMIKKVFTLKIINLFYELELNFSICSLETNVASFSEKNKFSIFYFILFYIKVSNKYTSFQWIEFQITNRINRISSPKNIILSRLLNRYY